MANLIIGNGEDLRALVDSLFTLRDPEKEAALSEEEREIGGLGIFLVKKSMDRFSYEYAHGQNILTMEKRW